MARFLNTLASVSSLLERLNEATRDEDADALRKALKGVQKVACDFELIYPSLTCLIKHPSANLQRTSSDGFERHSSAPPLHPLTAPKEKPLLTSHYQSYMEAGVNAMEAFALMSDPAASAYFDRVLDSGILRGPCCCMAAEILVKHIWYTGLEMKVSDIKMSPGLLAKLASYASGKAECLKAVTKGVSPDELLARVTLAKTEVRKGLLRRYMQALDESEGLQGITTRLSQRLGIDLDELHSDTALDIPWHVRQYLQKYERCTDDRKLLASMETQVIVLRAIGAQEPEMKENLSDSAHSTIPSSMNPFRLANTLAPTGQNSDRIKAHTKSALLRYNSSPCAFGAEAAAARRDLPTITGQLSEGK